MKNIKNLISFFLSTIFVLSIFTSCGKPDDDNTTTITTNTTTTLKINDNIETASLCFLLGKTSNVRIPNMFIIKNELKDLSNDSESYRVVVLDGKPDEISWQDTMFFPKRQFNQEKNNERVLQTHLNNIMNLMPEDTEIDILEGLESGRRALCDSEGKKRIVIFSSGISTAGELNFASNPNLINKRPSEIVDNLKVTNSLPDLSGCELEWYGFGDVSDKQEELSDFNTYRLKNIWIEILNACNIENPNDVFKDSLPIKNHDNVYAKSENEYPYVTPVIFPEMIEINEEEIGFKPNESSFINEEIAIKSLEYYAKCIRNANSTFYVVGCTATFGDPNNCLILSEKRASAVKNILCNNYNIPEESLEIYSLGQINLGGNYEWRCNDLNEDGSLNDLAQKNRKVMIINSNSEDGKRFIEQWESK